MISPHAIDPNSLLLSISLFGFVMSALLYASAHSLQSHDSGLIEYGRAMLAVGAAFLLFFLYGVIPDWLSLWLGSTVIIGGPAFIAMAHAKYYGQKHQARRVALLTALCFVGLAITLIFGMPTSAVVFCVSATAASLVAMSGWMIFRGSNWDHRSLEQRPIAELSVAGIAALTLTLAMLATLTLMGQGLSVANFVETEYQIAFFIATTLSIVAPAIGFLLLAHQRIRKELTDSARRDGLTGLYIRSAFMEEGTRLDSSSDKYAVVMIDIDHFKRINDTYGHAAGDTVLIHAGKMFAGLTRAIDLAARYGGEEFCVLLKGCDSTAAAGFATRVVTTAREQVVRIANGETVTFTVSCGFATNMDGRSVAELLEVADQGLYTAKRSGRNQVGRACQKQVSGAPASIDITEAAPASAVTQGSVPSPQSSDASYSAAPSD